MSEHLDRVAAVLNSLPFVYWDRCTGPTDSLAVFGWIYRPLAAAQLGPRLDFVLIEFDYGTPVTFTTSSAAWSRTIDKTLWPDADPAGHTPCKAVPDVFDGVYNVADWQQRPPPKPYQYYEYVCLECKAIILSDAAGPTICPNCGGETFEGSSDE